MFRTDIRLRVFVEDGERKTFDIRLDLWIGECTPNESFDIEDGVVGIQNSLDFGGVADEAVGIGEGHIRGRAEVTLVIGDDLDPVVVPYTYTAVVQDQSVVDVYTMNNKENRVDRRKTYQLVVPRSIPIALPTVMSRLGIE